MLFRMKNIEIFIRGVGEKIFEKRHILQTLIALSWNKIDKR